MAKLGLLSPYEDDYETGGGGGGGLPPLYARGYTNTLEIARRCRITCASQNKQFLGTVGLECRCGAAVPQTPIIQSVVNNNVNPVTLPPNKAIVWINQNPLLFITGLGLVSFMVFGKKK